MFLGLGVESRGREREGQEGSATSQQAQLWLCCGQAGGRRGPQSCLRATGPPLLETGGRRLAALTYRRRTGCSE